MLTRRAILGLLAAAFAGPALPARVAAARPHATIAIAGGHYHGLGRALKAGLGPGAMLALRREPANPHDPNAVAVHGPDGARLGYVPRAFAATLAPVLDAGAVVEAEVTGLLGAEAPPEGLRFTHYLPGDPVVELRIRA